MAAKLTRLTHKMMIQVHLVAEGCTICSSHAGRQVQKLLDTPSYLHLPTLMWFCKIFILLEQNYQAHIFKNLYLLQHCDNQFYLFSNHVSLCTITSKSPNHIYTRPCPEKDINKTNTYNTCNVSHVV